jgi:hypothetical protein
MHFPNLIVDNFFNNPQQIIDCSQKLEFKNQPDKRWAGLRTDKIHEVNYDLFDYVTKHIIRLVFPHDHEDMLWHTEMYFSKTNPKDTKYPDWVHRDDTSEFTAIIYLSDHNCGTNICHLNNPLKLINDVGPSQFHYYRNPTKEKPEIKDKIDSQFKNTISVNGKFNRLFLFDGNSWHRQQKFSSEDIKSGKDRLMLIAFFHEVSKKQGTGKLLFPITELKRY